VKSVTRVRLGPEEIKYITLFESMTGATVKDCVQEADTMGFLVKKGDMGLAIGKGGSNIERVRNTMGKSVWIMEFDEDEPKFVKNLFQPIKVKQVRISSANKEKTAIIEVNRQDRKRVIGPEGKRIKLAKEMAKRHFMIENIIVQVV